MYVHKYFRKVAYAIIGLLIMGSSLATFLIICENDIKAYLFFDDNYMRYLVHRPWFRLSSFLMGM